MTEKKLKEIKTKKSADDARSTATGKEKRSEETSLVSLERKAMHLLPLYELKAKAPLKYVRIKMKVSQKFFSGSV